ncbi:glycosyltransferase involved in cell wall biosynthesis [Allocatelliglobosispora scoriae]|uniref:Glycosyltransferase involved in cell wall biosynthesis n=1 Tax=Allocatelliglobosispora scoriae TaxID=643052 RepID=A0A841BYY4_9ACTN|nr:GT4 family glycosyltransferase PelF [Allocatelliglobosispora scoriae]MBB5872885.1 glycosyltransferase involved in cell wall biosynthesis [Allocatelliglobosispora scoriae]
MRVALINEGTYPYVLGGVSTWCDQLVRGLTDIDWHLVTMVGQASVTPALTVPGNVASLTAVPVWGRPRAPRRRLTEAAARMCAGMLGDSPEHLATFREALRELAMPHRADIRPSCQRCRDSPITCPRHGLAGRHPLYGLPLAELLLDAWHAAQGTGTRPLPPLTLRDADEAAVLIEHSVRPLAAVLPPVDVCHANANGLSSLVALAAKWRFGTPFLMTEHGVYLRERYLSTGDQSPGVKVALLRFHRALARLAYAEADLLAPVSGFNQRWEERHGADPARITIIPNGVDPERFPPLPEEPSTPTISWVGRIDPLKDLPTLIRALAVVRAQIPDARLYLAGPVPAGNTDYAEMCHELTAELGLTDAVTFAGPVASSREAFAAGHVAALSSISEGMPYTIVEAMMCERATVSTDVGGVAEMVGDAGIVVPPRDPVAFGEACITLLRDRELRLDLARRGRERALARFTLRRCLDAYLERYKLLTGGAA